MNEKAPTAPSKKDPAIHLEVATNANQWNFKETTSESGRQFIADLADARGGGAHENDKRRENIEKLFANVANE